MQSYGVKDVEERVEHAHGRRSLDDVPPSFEQQRGSEQEGASMSLPLAFSILWTSRRTIAVSTFVALLMSAALAFMLHDKFTASASFVPPGSTMGASASALMGQLAAYGEAGGLLEGKSGGDLYVAVLKSHTVTRQVVERLALMKVYSVKKESVAEATLAGRSSFTVDTKDPVVTIQTTDKDPQRARDIAAAYLQVLQQTTASMALTESSQRRQFYEQRLAREKDELAAAEVALKQNEEKSGLVEPSTQTSTNIQALAQIQAEITSQQAQLASLLRGETEENPDVQRVRSGIASLQAKAAQMENGAEHGFGRLSTAQVPELELDYIRKDREVKYHEALFDIIAKQYEAARLDEAKDAPLQVLDSPAVPDTKSGPPRLIIMAGGTFLGLLASSAWMFFRAATSAGRAENSSQFRAANGHSFSGREIPPARQSPHS